MPSLSICAELVPDCDLKQAEGRDRGSGQLLEIGVLDQTVYMVGYTVHSCMTKFKTY